MEESEEFEAEIKGKEIRRNISGKDEEEEAEDKNKTKENKGEEKRR